MYERIISHQDISRRFPAYIFGKFSCGTWKLHLIGAAKEIYKEVMTIKTRREKTESPSSKLRAAPNVYRCNIINGLWRLTKKESALT